MKKQTVRKTSQKNRDEDVESRLTALETDMGYVREQVENHIPTTLAEHGVILESIQRKLGDRDAVSKFISMCFKFVGALAGVVWSIKAIWPGHHD